MKPFGLSVLAAICGYLVGLFGGLLLIETVSSNTHDKSMEAAMTGAFIFGPLVAGDNSRDHDRGLSFTPFSYRLIDILRGQR